MNNDDSFSIYDNIDEVIKGVVREERYKISRKDLDHCYGIIKKEVIL